MNSTLAGWRMGGTLAAGLVLAAGWAGNALSATIRETYTLAPSGVVGSFVAHPDVVRSIVENGVGAQSVTLAIKAAPARGRHIVEMDVYVSRAVQRDVSFAYRRPLALAGRPEKRGNRVLWALPPDGDRAPVFDLTDQNIASPTRIDIYVIEKDKAGQSYSTLVETHYAALHAGFVYNH